MTSLPSQPTRSSSPVSISLGASVLSPLSAFLILIDPALPVSLLTSLFSCTKLLDLELHHISSNQGVYFSPYFPNLGFPLSLWKNPRSCRCQRVEAPPFKLQSALPIASSRRLHINPSGFGGSTFELHRVEKGKKKTILLAINIETKYKRFSQNCATHNFKPFGFVVQGFWCLSLIYNCLFVNCLEQIFYAMSKRAAKNLTIKPAQHEQNTVDDKYAEVFKDNHQPKRVRRNIYVENSAATLLPQIDEFVSPNLFLDHQSSSSRSETNLFLDHQSSSSQSGRMQCLGQNIIHGETQHMICNRQISDRYDKKGKNVVDISKDVENTVKKTLHVENSNLINRGQAFFQNKRTGIVKEYADLGDKNYKYVCTIEFQKRDVGLHFIWLLSTAFKILLLYQVFYWKKN
ncbi:uncharacterized protein LOC126585326 [Malus sylvestris]|uniref:uncharacterized protein LOC126585326 n=1 Tax=Malus sylvestris TaxID=3752 RepID=UPI0021AC0391|nr:uncharacterized protein LOC126585326 [Malus sylvestris]